MSISAVRWIIRHGASTTLRHNSSSSVRTMQAWQAYEYGSPDVLQLSSSLRVPIVTRPDDVLVKVHAASINPLDVMMLKGYGASVISAMRCVYNLTLTPQEFPLTPGRDFSGVVMATGSCVKSFKPGDEVFGVTGPQESGSHAEIVKTSAWNLAKKPSILNHVEASSIPYAALTAWSALSTFGGVDKNTAYGKRVLVIGASGGVGSIAVQILKAWGAEVTATCATDAVEMVRSLAVDNVVDYLLPDFRKELKNIGKFDFILDTVGAKDQYLDLLKTWKSSKCVTIVSPLLQNADSYGIIFGNVKSFMEASRDTFMGLKNGQSVRWAYLIPNGRALKTIKEMTESRQVVPVIDEVFSFHDVPEGYRKLMEGHARGKTVIDFCSEKEQAENKQDVENIEEEIVSQKL